MDFKKIASRITGLSCSIVGVGWNPPELEVEKARKIVAFMEDRRVLYGPYELECPHHCVQSIVEIRAFLTAELQKLDDASVIACHLSAMRAACRKFMDTLQKQGIDSSGHRVRGMGDEYVFHTALGELRGVFGTRILLLAQNYGLSVEDALASIFPFQDDPSKEARVANNRNRNPND